ncbi:MAG: carbonic anhydrase [Candidatus Methanomethylophilaceae archaeon]|nr:carbonic anhydrase [Candidatus Methanomethylophilaceae archaeon]
MSNAIAVPAEEALERLRKGNSQYSASGRYGGDISETVRIRTAEEGQRPYAAIVTCSDSRVIPEAVFSAGIGELFVIRSAGNVVDGCTLGSLEYAVGHMGVALVVVMGHTSCGAIAEALKGFHEGHAIEIIDDIRAGIGDEKDPLTASKKNVENSVRLIAEDLGQRHGVKVVGALYDIRSGKVEFGPFTFVQ